LHRHRLLIVAAILLTVETGMTSSDLSPARAGIYSPGKNTNEARRPHHLRSRLALTEAALGHRDGHPSIVGSQSGRSWGMERARLIAVNIAKLPSVPRQILKDIPRPPNSASRDD
jgi:hypothetical protein